MSESVDNKEIVSAKEIDKSLLGAILFSAGGTVEYDRLEAFFGSDSDTLAQAVGELKDILSSAGLTVIEVAGGYRLVTASEHIDELRRFYTEIKETGLTKAALETLSVIAYKQPCTRVDIEEIRGVASDSVVRGLLDKRLIKVKDRTDGPGRPFRYVTTDKFLELFGLKSIKDLPRVEGVEQISLKVKPEGE